LYYNNRYSISNIRKHRRQSSEVTSRASSVKDMKDDQRLEIYEYLKTGKGGFTEATTRRGSEASPRKRPIKIKYNMNNKELIRSIVLEDNPKIKNIMKMRKKLVLVNDYYLMKGKTDDNSGSYKIVAHLEEVMI
jgi:hypothetical protein